MQANVGTLDRAMRVIAGIVLITATLLGYIGAWGWIGVIFIATGLLRFCLVYKIFSASTCKAPDPR